MRMYYRQNMVRLLDTKRILFSFHGYMCTAFYIVNLWARVHAF